MSELSSFSQWLSDQLSDEELLFRDPDLSRAQFRSLCRDARRAVSLSQSESIALDFGDPVRFIAAFIACLSAGRTPALFTSHKVNYRRLKGNYGAVFTDKTDVPAEAEKIYWCFEAADLPIDKEDFSIPLDASFDLYTSGSTSTPKRVTKTVRQMDLEAEYSLQLFKERIKGSELLASVERCHLFGLTFALWLPALSGIPLHSKSVTFPDELVRFTRPTSLITSPTFLRNSEEGCAGSNFEFILTAGGPLSSLDITNGLRLCANGVHEIYGSTETGLIASRHRLNPSQDQNWRLAPGLRLEQQGEDTTLFSPFAAKENFTLDDRIAMVSEREFTLLGRKDKAVKIGERRFSLEEIKQRTQEVTGLETVILMLENSHRKSAAAVVVSSKEHVDRSVRQWREKLRDSLEPLAIPRYWRSVEKIPVNAQGKMDTAALLELFDA